MDEYCPVHLFCAPPKHRVIPRSPVPGGFVMMLFPLISDVLKGVLPKQITGEPRGPGASRFQISSAWRRPSWP